MSKIAFVFPGQGSQHIGMGKEITETYKEANEIFQQANETLGYDLQRICFEGPEDTLKLTSNTQPALVTTSIALYEVAKKSLPRPAFVAGHSLGEYAALVAAGTLSFQEAVYAVHKRGEYMNEAVPFGQGAMSAVMGAERELIEEVCESVTALGMSVQVANYNCPGQIVISGTVEGVEKATEVLKEKGTKRVIPLPVSGPFHSELMKPASDKLKPILETSNFNDAAIPVVINVSAQAVTDASEIQDGLLKQVYSSVLWEDSVRYMIEQGVTTFVEIGSGKVLAGLIKKIDRSVTVYTISDSVSLQETIEKMEETTC